MTDLSNHDVPARDRIGLHDTGTDMMVKMAEGNPGALTALMQLIQDGYSIDPQAAMGGIHHILLLDTCRIYGAGIYVLWSDKCKKDTRRLILLLRGCQLGILPIARLQQLAADQRYEHTFEEVEFDALDAKVCARLELFQRPTAHSQEAPTHDQQKQQTAAAESSHTTEGQGG